MLRFYHKLSAADAVKQQQQQLAASAASTETRAVATAALRRGPGRPKKVVNANDFLAAAAAAQPTEPDSDHDEPAHKRVKYHNWSDAACSSASLIAALPLTHIDC